MLSNQSLYLCSMSVYESEELQSGYLHGTFRMIKAHSTASKARKAGDIHFVCFGLLDKSMT